MQNLEIALSEAADGDTAGLAEIYEHERSSLAKAAARITHDKSTAEDIVHDAFAQILRDAAQFDPARGSARGWIYAIVRNTALKSLRRSAHEIPTSEEILQSMAEHRGQPEDPQRRIDATQALETLLVEMEPRRRATIVMALIDGKTHADIAKSLGIPIGTIKAWIRRELAALRAKLG